MLIAELHSVVNLPIPENLVITWPYTDRPPVQLFVRTTGKPMFTFTLSFFRLVYFDSWSWQSFVSTCEVFNCLFPLDVQNEIQLVSRVFWYSWLICLLFFLADRCVACQSRKSDFRWHRFRFSPCLMRIKEDSKFSSNSRVTW